MLADALRRAVANASSQLYVDDVFSAYLYTGNGSTQTITNGIDLAGEGGLVWGKNRGSANGHWLYDSARGLTSQLSTQTTGAQSTVTDGVTAFNGNGFSLGGQGLSNGFSSNYASWTFRKAPKFFDVVTYTGTGANRTIAHDLGQEPGMIIVKRLSAAAPWYIYHRSIGANDIILFDTGAKQASAASWNSTTPTDTEFSIGTNNGVNSIGDTFVAYLFAHDTDPDGLIQCGSFTTDGSGNATVTLGWEPQYLLIKKTNSTGSWTIWDTMRGWSNSSEPYLFADLSNAESTSSNSRVPTATGFRLSGYSASDTFIYLAIRRPNKPPTSGAEVYKAIARTGTSAEVSLNTVGFAPDLMVTKHRGGTRRFAWVDRLRGAKPFLCSSATDAEIVQPATDGVKSFNNDGVTLTADNSAGPYLWNLSGDTHIHHFFRRAPGFMDVVCYTGTGTNTTILHKLGVAPELIIARRRNDAVDWCVGYGTFTSAVFMNSASGNSANSVYWNNTAPTSTVFSLGTNGNLNTSNHPHIAYLFATLPGISKVGSYTGTGTTKQIDCGFAAGARFVLIKRTDSTGDWYLWDSTRGIIAGNDPRLSLNSTAAEVTTDDWVDPYSAGFELSSAVGNNVNISGATYIFLAIS